MFGFKRTHLIPSPSGRFYFAGRVPVVLGWKRQDGEPLTKEDAQTIVEANTPGLLGYSQRSYATREEALAAAEAIGVEVAE